MPKLPLSVCMISGAEAHRIRPALESELQTWSEYRRGLRPEDRPFFDVLANLARQHADAHLLSLVEKIDVRLERAASRQPGVIGSGGMFSKIQAAKKYFACQ